MKKEKRNLLFANDYDKEFVEMKTENFIVVEEARKFNFNERAVFLVNKNLAKKIKNKKAVVKM